MKNDSLNVDKKPLTHSSFFLKIGVVVAISFVLDITFRFLGYFSILTIPWFGVNENLITLLLKCIEVGMNYLPLILLVLILIRLKKSMYRGHEFWFSKVRPPLFVLFLILFITIPALIIHLTIPVYALQIVKYLASVRLNALTARMGLLPRDLTLFIQCLVWLWWCDSQPKQLRSLLFSFFAWVLYEGTLWIMLWPIIEAFQYRGLDIVLLIKRSVTARNIVFTYTQQIFTGSFALIIYLILTAVQKIILFKRKFHT